MFRWFFRLLAIVLLFGAIAVLGVDLYHWYQGAGFTLTPMGEAWFRIDASSLNLLQAVIERYIWAPLWNPGIVTVLLWPAVLVLGVPGLVLLLLTWPKSR